MRRKKFKLSHSVLGLLALLIVQGFCMHLFPGDVAAWLVICFSAIGAGVVIYVATEVIEEVRGTPHMFKLLAAVVAEFIVFFAAEYWHLALLYPGSFPSLPSGVTSLLLQSLMVFVFNPIYLPADIFGRGLLLVNELSSVVLVLFILQNVSQIHKTPTTVAKRPSTRKKKTESK